MIDIPDLGEGFLEMWRELLLLAKQAPAPWTLIGAHMVALHGWKAGRMQPRASKDADILVNARVAGGGTRKVSETLLSRGFSLDGVSPEGIGHRFVKGHVRLDVLGPDGVGSRISLQTVHGARTVEVPGGSQALNLPKGQGQNRIPRPASGSRMENSLALLTLRPLALSFIGFVVSSSRSCARGGSRIYYV